jgi:hypothetical protein
LKSFILGIATICTPRALLSGRLVVRVSKWLDLIKIAVLGQAPRGLFGKINIGDGNIEGTLQN